MKPIASALLIVLAMTAVACDGGKPSIIETRRTESPLVTSPDDPGADSVVQLSDYVTVPYDVTVSLPPGLTITEAVAHQCGEWTYVDATLANSEADLVVHSPALRYDGSSQPLVSLTSLAGFPNGGYMALSLPPERPGVNSGVVESEPYARYPVADPSDPALSLELRERVPPGPFDEGQAPDWRLDFDLENRGPAAVSSLGLLAILRGAGGDVMGSLVQSSYAEENMWPQGPSHIAPQFSDECLIAELYSDARSVEYWFPVANGDGSFYVLHHTAELAAERGKYAIAEQAIEAVEVASDTFAYQSNCLEANYDIGPARNDSGGLVIPFRVVVSGDSCTTRPTPCEGVWVNDVTYNQEALREGRQGYEVRDVFDRAYPFVDGEGISAVDANLVCGEVYEGSWVFAVDVPVGKITLQHPDLDRPINLLVSGAE